MSTPDMPKTVVTVFAEVSSASLPNAAEELSALAKSEPGVELAVLNIHPATRHRMRWLRAVTEHYLHVRVALSIDLDVAAAVDQVHGLFASEPGVTVTGIYATDVKA